MVASAEGIETPAAAYVESTYPRLKGEKVLHRINVPPTNLTNDPNVALGQYEWVFPIDTNTPNPASREIAFVGFMQTKVLFEEPGELWLRIYREIVIEVHNVKVAPERLGWWLVVSSVVSRAPEARIALLVDSELSELTALNQREKPLISGFFLPNGFELLYASTDSGGGYVANDLLRGCDHNARKVYRLPKSENAPPLRESQGSAPFSHIRVWDGSISSVG